MSGSLTHLGPDGRPHMVDVGEKAPTRREATATGTMRLGAAAQASIAAGTAKGDVLAVAQLAGIMGAKRTGDLIPLCHPLTLDRVDVDVRLVDGDVVATATVATTGRTGVEMEALTAVSVALLTAYDMLKAVDRGLIIEGIRLLSKTGGRSGTWRA